MVVLERAGYIHEVVNHGARAYTSGDCHVNGLGGFWARLKLSIRSSESVLGTHVQVSRKQLLKYVKEFEFRYNRRKRPASMFGELVANL